MIEVQERVDRLEVTLERFMASAETINRRLDRNIERLDQNIVRLDRNIERLDRNFERLEQNGQRLDRNYERLNASVEEIKRESRKHALEMARIADRIGRFSEDIVAPNLPRLAREVFGIDQVDFSGQRIEKRHAADPAKSREFDFVLAGRRKLLVNETKSTVRVKYIDDFAAALHELFEYFPEYRGCAVIPIFASLSLSPDFLRRLTRLRIYAMALADRTMELLNFDEVSAKLDGKAGRRR
jgi:hypothetical protein